MSGQTRVTIFGQAKKRTQRLSVADCITLNGNITRTDNIYEKPISKSAPGTKFSVWNAWDFAYICTTDKRKHYRRSPHCKLLHTRRDRTRWSDEDPEKRLREAVVVQNLDKLRIFEKPPGHPDRSGKRGHVWGNLDMW